MNGKDKNVQKNNKRNKKIDLIKTDYNELLTNKIKNN